MKVTLPTILNTVALTLFAVLGWIGALGCGGDGSPKADRTSSSEGSGSSSKWYEGGTLHRAKMSDWAVASPEDKLATCADFVANSLKLKDMADMKRKATALVAGIDRAYAPETDHMSIAEVSASVMILAGWK